VPTLTNKGVGPTLLTAAAVTMYTAPALTRFIVKTIAIANTSAVAATVFLSFGTDAVGTRILAGVSIPANSTTIYTGCEFIIEAAGIIQAYSGTASVLTLTLGGFTVLD